MKNYFEKIKSAIQKLSAFAHTAEGKQYAKRALIFAGAFVVFFIILWFIDLFKTPADFRVVKPPAGEHISVYLTNYIVPEMHNKSQLGTPFDLAVSQDGINEILARHLAHNALAKAGLSDLSASFKKGEIVFTARTNYKGFDFIVSMNVEPKIDKNGKLFLNAGNFQIGRSSLPFAAEFIKGKIIAAVGENFKAEKENEFINAVLQTGKIAPVFKFNHSKLRIEKIDVQDQNLVLHFCPQ